MSTYTEEDIDEAIQLHRTGVSVRRSAEAYGIPPSILQDRVRLDEFEQKQKLERLHEAFRNWILILAVLGCPPKYHEATEQATVLAAEVGYDEPIKRKWVEVFLRKNPDVVLVEGNVSVPMVK